MVQGGLLIASPLTQKSEMSLYLNLTLTNFSTTYIENYELLMFFQHAGMITNLCSS